MLCVPSSVWTSTRAALEQSGTEVATTLLRSTFWCTDCAERITRRPALRALAKLRGKDVVARPELLSPYNFAAFYAAELVPPAGTARSRRVLYLDTDVVVTSELAELFGADLGSHAVGAVEDCTQNPLRNYVAFRRRKFPWSLWRKSALRTPDCG